MKNIDCDITLCLNQTRTFRVEGDVSMKKKRKLLDKETREDTGTARAQKNNQPQTQTENHGSLNKDLYLDTIKAIFEKYRGRISTYYCSNLACKNIFWHAQEGYTCPECGSFGIISEFNADKAGGNGHDQHIIGCLDTIGRLICSECMQNYDTDDDIGFIVYKDTQPYSFESCDICRKELRRDVNTVS